MEIELQKKHVKDPLTHEIRKLHLEANRASKFENGHQHCIGDETVRAQVSEKFTFPCLAVSFQEVSCQSNNSPKRNVTSAVLKNRNQNLKSNICRTRHVTSRR